MLSATDSLKGVVNQIQDLPTLPKVVERVISLVEDPETSSATLGEAIATDSSMASKILKAANSAYYGLPRKISTINQAAVVLGFKTIKNLVLTASVFSAFGGKSGDRRFNRTDFWLHALGCATTCRILSKETRIGIPEEAFFTGLLHDIGIIILDQFLQEDFGRILDLMDESVSIQDASREILDVNHNELGAWLCDKWNFPVHIQESVAYYPSPEQAQANKSLVALIHISHAVAREANLGHSGEVAPAHINHKVWDFVNISHDEVLELREEIVEEFEKATVFMELMDG